MPRTGGASGWTSCGSPPDALAARNDPIARRLTMPTIDRRRCGALLGGSTAVAGMSAEARADAIEHYLAANVAGSATPPPAGAKRPPTVAELEAQIPTRTYRR